MIPARQREPRLELPRYLELCRQHDMRCFLLFPECSWARDRYVMACHSNLQEHGRGAYEKTHDCFAVPGCHECHHNLDARACYPHAFKVERTRAALLAFRMYLVLKNMITFDAPVPAIHLMSDRTWYELWRDGVARVV